MGLAVISADVDGWDAVRQEVKGRDRACVFSPLPPLQRAGRPLPGFPDHFCRDRWNRPIEWHRTSVMLADIELDHVKEEPMAGAKAKDDSAHLVVVCRLAHERLATSAEGREYERTWLAFYYPDVWAVFLERRA